MHDNYAKFAIKLQTYFYVASTMIRYLRLLRTFIANCLTRELEFRGHFLLVFFIDIMWYAVQMSVFEVVYLYTPTLGGLRHEEIMIFLGVLFLTDSINMMFVSSNFWRFPSLIATGDLDFILLKPVSTVFFSLFRYFNVGSILNFITSLSVLLWGISHYTGMISGYNIVAFILLVLCSELLMISFQLCLCAIAVYLVNADGIQQLYYSLDILAAKPDTIYPQFLRSMLLTWFPMALLASVPAFALMGKVSAYTIVSSIIVTVLFSTVSILFFRRSLYSYSGASS
jgi:ABC-2 type transport system permease protein